MSTAPAQPITPWKDIAMDIGRVRPVHFNAGHLPLIVGDTHGQYDMLHALIRSVKFGWDFKLYRDPLILTGDLTDRGAQCYNLLQMLDRPNVHSVLGNHEMNYLRLHKAFTEASIDESLTKKVREKGGHWFLALSQEQRKDVIRLMRKMPLAIQLSHPRMRIGIVHANGHDRWFDTCNDISIYPQLDEHERRNLDHLLLYTIDRCLKQQRNPHLKKVDRFVLEPIRDVFLQICGHNSFNQVHAIHNCMYVDTGAKLLRHPNEKWEYGSGRLTGLMIAREHVIEHWVRQVPTWAEAPAQSRLMQHNGVIYEYGHRIVKTIPLENRIHHEFRK